MTVTFDDQLGPIDYLIIEFPGGRVTAAGFAQLLELVDGGSIRVLDLEFVAATADGGARIIGLDELGPVEGFDMTVFDGASSGLADTTDLAEIGRALRPGSIAAILVYEELTMLPVIAAWERADARVLGEGVIPVADMLAALDTEPNTVAPDSHGRS
ncbi:hypothetical protein GCM10022198_03290 [Klugiella xanthotipulae]|uniref:DUF1269 domain-containing protein n=1 Tax=Klugiella xanthotipulae TaxID=244735 RepID=A0A543I747_9MICO|nr:DUF6325 family protein [Klugiella xanthotipulae]TQM66375.1 hypothetical protein FB466_1215 [Klugiella xanthotipulae]